MTRVDSTTGQGDGAGPAGRRDADGRSATTAFYRSVPSFPNFHDIAEPRMFVPLPDDWLIGVADIVASTEAIGRGAYKKVNTAGAAVISALSNALGTLDFPFIFGGDGASFAVAPDESALARDALAATVAWVGSELGLVLRGATVTLGEIRRHGHDVRIARFEASANLTHAMFSGGGLAWAERRLKAGELSVPPAPAGSQPDLRGLSCRFRDISSKHGVILSVVIRPASIPDEAFGDLVQAVLALAEQAPDAARPVPVFGAMGGIGLRSIAMEARLQRRPNQSLFGSLLRAGGRTALAAAVLAAGRDLRGFGPKRYLREVVENSDFRKYEDGLMMTLDCTLDHAGKIEAMLEAAVLRGVTVYGLHRQAAATITCVIPSVLQSDHVHFIDGASGGYAMAAQDLKSRLASSPAL